MDSLIEGKGSCYRGGHFNGGRMVTLEVTLMEQKWSCYRGGSSGMENGHVTVVVSLMDRG